MHLRYFRLINAYHHLLASKICESMGMNQDEVLRHWACARIFADGSTTDDEDLKSIIVDKLVGCKGVKYATIAEHAQVNAKMLLSRCSWILGKRENEFGAFVVGI